jgi:m7GpppX diphosphatase
MQELFILNETYEDWQNVTSKYIKESSFSLKVCQIKSRIFSLDINFFIFIKWVYNILDHKTETERIIYEDNDKINGFILLPGFRLKTNNKL